MKNSDQPCQPVYWKSGSPINEGDGDILEGTKPLLGLTKREYFAGLALQGLLASDTSESLKFSFEGVMPKIAVMYADELLKQLEK